QKLFHDSSSKRFLYSWIYFCFVRNIHGSLLERVALEVHDIERFQPHDQQAPILDALQMHIVGEQYGLTRRH
ncbi:MAG: hypothetical protein KDI49_09240, partial [Gammaproteobacteria bacterium]|nr:hypothetical protein [Gammaproteobacteria bacterium]